MTTLSVVVFKREQWWVAQCLQHDIGAQSLSNVDDVIYELQRSIVGHIAICKQHNLEPFGSLGRAPQMYWDKFEAASNRLTPMSQPFRSPIPELTPPQEYRIAA